MSDWRYNDSRWRDRVGDDVSATVREALRRAVDMRDTVLEAGGRPTMLVDVLNHLVELLQVDTSSLWDSP
jgi:hypothetical protein